MANTDLLNQEGFTQAGRAGNANGAEVATPANYASVSAMRTRLAAINGTYYTSARLDQMTVNDMVYAIRVNDDATTINARGAGA